MLRIISVFAFGCSLGIAVCNIPPGFRCRKAVPRGLFIPLFIQKGHIYAKTAQTQRLALAAAPRLSIVFSRTVVTVVARAGAAVWLFSVFYWLS